MNVIRALLALYFIIFYGVIVAGHFIIERRINLEQQRKEYSGQSGEEKTFHELFELALCNGDAALAEQLLAEKRGDIDLTNDNLLGYAIWPESDTQSAKMVQILLQEGLSPNARAVEGYGSTVLNNATMFGRLGAVRALVSGGAYVNAKNEAGITPVEWTFYNWSRTTGERRVEVLKYLLSQGASVGTMHGFRGARLLAHCNKLRANYANGVHLAEGSKELDEARKSLKGYLASDKDLATLNEMQALVEEQMKENTLPKECPFSGTIR